MSAPPTPLVALRSSGSSPPPAKDKRRLRLRVRSACGLPLAGASFRVRAYCDCQWARLCSFSIARRAAARPPRYKARQPGLVTVALCRPVGPGGARGQLRARGGAQEPAPGPRPKAGRPVSRAGWGRRRDRGALHRPGPSLSRRGTRAGAAPAPFVLKHTPRGLSAKYGTMRVRLVEAPC